MSDTLETRLDGLVHRVSSLEHSTSALVEIAPPVADWKRIVDVCCNAYGVDRASVFGASRCEAVAECRHVAMWFCCRGATLVAYGAVGRFYDALGRFFHRDRTSVVYGCKRVHRQASVDPAFAARVEAIRKELEDEQF